MLDAEVAERGSLAEAERWVFPPDKSMHVQGLAIDVGDGPAADWLHLGQRGIDVERLSRPCRRAASRSVASRRHGRGTSGLGISMKRS